MNVPGARARWQTVNVHRVIAPESIRLELETPVPEPEEGEETLRPAAVQRFKEQVLEEMAELLMRSGRVGHAGRLLRDLIHRERRASTAVGHGVAFPHVHSDQAKEMLVAIARAPQGIPFDSADGQPVRLIVAMVAPHDNDRLYLNLVRRFSEMFSGDAALAEILAAKDEYEVLRAVQGYL